MKILILILLNFRLDPKVATAYVNIELEQLVLAFKSNDCCFKDILVKDSNINMEIEGIVLNQFVPELLFCYQVTEEVNLIARKHNLNLSFTGYSSGAWLAEYAIYFSHLYFQNCLTKAVLFESPGIPNVNKSKNLGYRIYDLDLDKMNIVNYLTQPSFNNTSSRHAFGEAWRIFIESDDSDNKKKEFFKFLPPKIKSKVFSLRFFLDGLYTMFNHSSLEKIASLLEKPGFYKERVKVWPVMKFNFKKADLNENLKLTVKKITEKSLDLIPLPEFIKKIPCQILENIISNLANQLVNFFVPGLHLLINILIEYSKGTIEIPNIQDFEDFDYSLLRKDLRKPSLFYCTTPNDEQRFSLLQRSDANYWSSYRHIHDLKMYIKIDQLEVS